MGNSHSHNRTSSGRQNTLNSRVLTGSDDSMALIRGSVGSSGKITRQSLHRMCVEFANVLRNNGIKPGDVVTVVDSNTVEFVVAFLGVTYARAVAAPLNQNYTTEEFKYYMEDADSKLLVTGAVGNSAAEAAGIVPCMSVTVTCCDDSDDATLKVDGKEGFGEDGGVVLTGSSDVYAKDGPRPRDVALFLHTSGTTSRPKGVPLSHENLVASLENIKDTYEFTPEDVSLLVMPLFHVHGLMAGLLSPLLSGASVVLPEAGKFSAGTFWQDATEHKVTFYTAVPTMHQILVSRAEQDYPKDNPPPLRVIRSCSSSLAPTTLFQVEKLFGAPVLEAYAMTEASHQMTSNPLPKHGERKPGTVGKPQGSVKVAILDDKCRKLGPGEVGEVCIQGPNVTKGYRNNPKANKEAFAGGWFHTGDQGYLSEDGYLTLTGRIKELINRGGEKISPLEVDATMLAHPLVAEACSFAAPDEKYGEEVAAAVVLKPSGQEELKANGEDAIISSIQEFCKEKISAFKVPKQVFITDSLPKNPTGKIQRRFMVDAFINKTKSPGSAKTGYDVAATALYKLGIRYMFGVIGIPVTQMASAAQAAGIRFISFRNEQAAGYAAAAAGFLTGKPGVLLTVSGPGMVHGIAGLSHAKVNGWPLIMISGSCETSEVGKGAFQELDQCKAASQYVKGSTKALRVQDIPKCLEFAFRSSMSGGFGSSYVDIPSNVFMDNVNDSAEMERILSRIPQDVVPKRSTPVRKKCVNRIYNVMKSSKRPLIVLGGGSAAQHAEESLQRLIEIWQVPFISSSMARGVVPDSSTFCVNAARSLALAKADTVIVLGNALNWQLHFGDAPKWSKDAKFILVDGNIPKRDRRRAHTWTESEIASVANALAERGQVGKWDDWHDELCSKVASSKEKMASKLSKTAFPLNYHTSLRIIRDEINKLEMAPVVVSEGANTMDQARILLEPVDVPRCRLDAGAWGTMGIGPGCAIAAAVTTGRHVVAVEGDSAFGFSGMEVETMCRYKLPITVVVFNNGGIYGGDRRTNELREAAEAGLEKAGFAEDPAPTAFVPNARYDLLATAFGGDGHYVKSAQELQDALNESLRCSRPSVINVVIDPKAGVESGTVHAFNAPKK